MGQYPAFFSLSFGGIPRIPRGPHHTGRSLSRETNQNVMFQSFARGGSRAEAPRSKKKIRDAGAQDRTGRTSILCPNAESGKSRTKSGRVAAVAPTHV
jgi:hypothetical protein